MTNFMIAQETMKSLKGLPNGVIFNVIEEWFETEVLTRDECIILWNRYVGC